MTTNQRLAPLVPDEPTESLSAHVAMLVHAFQVTEARPGVEDAEALTVVERPVQRG